MGKQMGASLLPSFPPFTVCWELCDLVSQDFKDRTKMVPMSVKAFPNCWLAFLAQEGRDLNTVNQCQIPSEGNF